MYTPQESAELIKSLAKGMGETVKDMLLKCELSDRVVSNMKDGSMPSADKLAIIASHYGITSERLLGIEKGATEVAPESEYVNELRDILSKVSEEGALRILETARDVEFRETFPK